MLGQPCVLIMEKVSKWLEPEEESQEMVSHVRPQKLLCTKKIMSQNKGKLGRYTKEPDMP